jgi:hypothetical protein
MRAINKMHGAHHNVCYSEGRIMAIMTVIIE